MRLGQLARQLGVSPKEILRKLENDFKTEIKSHPNAKVPDELLDEITKAFSKKVQEKVDEIEEEVKEVSPEPIVEEKEIKEEVKTVHSLDSDDATEVLGKIETEIPTLDGPKIIGKIDIPEIELRRIAERNAEKAARPVRTKRPKKRPESEKRKKSKLKVSESFEEKRKRELKEIEAKRKQTAESLKELNKKRYEEKSKNIPAPKPKKKSKKKKTETIKVQKQAASNPVKAKPTSLFGKFWSWLNDA